jgi:hypothetical protein
MTLRPPVGPSEAALAVCDQRKFDGVDEGELVEHFPACAAALGVSIGELQRLLSTA